MVSEKYWGWEAIIATLNIANARNTAAYNRQEQLPIECTYPPAQSIFKMGMLRDAQGLLVDC